MEFVAVLKGPKIPFVIRPITAAVVAKTNAVFVQPNIRKHMAFVESLLETSPGGGQFLCGEHSTAADILMSYPLRDGEGESSRLGDGKGGKMLDAFPRVRAYLEILESQPGFKLAQKRIEELEGKKNGMSKSSGSRVMLVIFNHICRLVVGACKIPCWLHVTCRDGRNIFGAR